MTEPLRQSLGSGIDQEATRRMALDRIAIATMPGVTLRLPEPGDAAELARSFASNRAALDRWNPAPPDDFYTEAGQAENIRQMRLGHDKGALLPLLIVRDGRIVGDVSLFQINRGPLQCATVGYWVDAGEQGRGIATAAVGAAVEVARDLLRLHRIEAGVSPRNPGSQRVLEKCGFTRIGLAPRYLFAAGDWQDQILYQRILGSEPPV